MTELCESDLEALRQVMHSLEAVSKIDGVYAAEIRVRVDDVPSWAVVGWGEAGEPALLRFEEDGTVQADPIKPNPNTYTTTLNAPAFDEFKPLTNPPFQKKHAAPVKCRCGELCYCDDTTCGPNGCYNCPA